MVIPLLAAASPWIPAIGAGLGALGGLIANRQSAKEAERNRDFQERMSSTSHQREVIDLQSAGLNPILSANRGASTPSGGQAPVSNVSESSARGLAAGLAVQQAKAQIRATNAAALKTEVEAADLQTQFNLPGRYDAFAADQELRRMSADQMRAMLPLAIQKAKAEIAQIGSAARAQTAAAILNELQSATAENIATLQKRLGALGAMGPAASGAFRLMSQILLKSKFPAKGLTIKTGGE